MTTYNILGYQESRWGRPAGPEIISLYSESDWVSGGSLIPSRRQQPPATRSQQSEAWHWRLGSRLRRWALRWAGSSGPCGRCQCPADQTHDSRLYDACCGRAPRGGSPRHRDWEHIMYITAYTLHIFVNKWICIYVHIISYFLLHIIAYNCIFRAYFLLHICAYLCIFPCIFVHISFCIFLIYLHIFAYF